ncbi:unnamed protein product [Didymodactylos carnosus]|uniref:Reverse transcriptase domain-containing protein n=1 Tax=Didymodactylos carnosus TaxID=1234261 RepID=A0A8S2FMV3_9BILA|nr:unnamed protein product [Didymodactylos carnosus]CAF4295676.1 unnamed protein product [Didymodactylos carnosus]
MSSATANKKVGFSSFFNSQQEEAEKPKEIPQHTGALPKFNGESPEQWLTDLNFSFKTIRLSADMKLDYLEDLFQGKTLNWYYEHQSQFKGHQSILKSILIKNQKPFDTSKPTIAKSSISHAIETVAHFPPRSKSLPFFGPKLPELKDLVNPLLGSGHVIPSNSHYASPAVVTRKKDGSGRLVIDYKKINAVTMSDNHPLPNMEKTLQELGDGFKYFSKLDLRSGFWQIRIHPKDRHKTAFATPFGLFEWRVLPQGLKNSSPTFQKVMEKTLQSCRPFCLVYIDDIMVF